MFGKIKENQKHFRKHFAKKTLNLITSGFGLVAALAWNELIKEFVSEYIEPFFGGSSAIISLFIYAVLITFLAVLVTYNLARISKD